MTWPGIDNIGNFTRGRNVSLVIGRQFRFLKICTKGGLLGEIMTWTGIDNIGNIFSTPSRRVGGIEVQLHSFVTSALYGVSGQLHTLAPTPSGKHPGLP
jgi:hypothetical protein